MADDLVRRYVEPDDDLARAPHPFDHIVASPVYSPDWGRGWLGYTVVGDTTDLWFVYGDLSGTELLDYTKLMTYNDKTNSRLWMILIGAESWEDRHYQGQRHGVLVFLLNPPEDAVLFPVPANLKKVMEEYGGRRVRDRATDEDE